MTTRRQTLFECLAIVSLVLGAAAPWSTHATPPEPASGSWTRWGGPNGNFVAESEGLASSWPEAGPRRLWEREIGGGYSAILVEDGRLYTMYRDEGDEVVLAMDATDGATVWEHRYASLPEEGHVHRFGDGPRATPLIAGDRLYTIGIAGRMFCLDKATGDPRWSHDLWGELGGNVLNHGYSSSPIEYKDTVIALVGGPDAGIVAFDKESGAIRWKGPDFRNSYSTPTLLDVDGELQLVVFMATELIGVDPDDGSLRWSYAHENQWRQNVNQPVMADENHLFMSSPEAGARGLRLTRDGKRTLVEEVWTARKVQFYHGTSVRSGDWVYGTTGTRSPAMMTAVNIKTGEIGWRERGFAKANVVGADGRLIVLDEDGVLTLATATPKALTVHARVDLLGKVAWTVPTVVGARLYARDQTHVVALALD